MITVTVQRGTSYADRLRDYQLELDGVVIGRVSRESSLTVQVQPGRHRLRAKIDWCSSNTVTFEAADNETVVFDVASSLQGWRVVGALFALFAPRRWLTLQRVGSSACAA